MPYFLKTETEIKGPIGDSIVEMGLKNGKISHSTQVSTSRTGPWSPIADAFPNAISSTGFNTPDITNSDPPAFDTSLDLGDLDLAAVQSAPVAGNLQYAAPHRPPREATNRTRVSKTEQKKRDEEKKKLYLLIGAFGVAGICAIIAIPLFFIVVLSGNQVAESEREKQRQRGLPPSAEAVAKREQFREGVVNMAGGFKDRDKNRVATGAKQVGDSTSNRSSTRNDSRTSSSSRSSSTNSYSPPVSRAKVKKVKVGVGDVTITDDPTGISHVKIECNNGNVIDADWKRNPYNDFGYDVYEPTVTMTTNRLAIMVTVRGVIANYLNGEY